MEHCEWSGMMLLILVSGMYGMILKPPNVCLDVDQDDGAGDSGDVEKDAADIEH